MNPAQLPRRRAYLAKIRDSVTPQQRDVFDEILLELLAMRVSQLDWEEAVDSARRMARARVPRPPISAPEAP